MKASLLAQLAERCTGITLAFAVYNIIIIIIIITIIIVNI